MVLAFLCSAYDEEELEGGDVRTVLHFHPALAPVKVAILPLSKKLSEGAEKVYAPVSYTHLDVYKRQQLYLPLWRYGCRRKVKLAGSGIFRQI